MRYFYFNLRKDSEEHYRIFSKRNMSIPKSIGKPIKEVCAKHNLTFKVTGADKRYAHKQKSKILIFGNEDVSPNDFYLILHFYYL